MILECSLAHNGQGLLAVAAIELRPLEQKPIKKPKLK
jgi:hypothetical protein